MLCDERKHIRELGLRRLLKVRLEHNNGVRKFAVPKLNFQSEDLIDMIKWMDITITEPTMAKHITENLKNYISEAKEPSCQMQSIYSPHFPCHTQVVEEL